MILGDVGMPAFHERLDQRDHVLAPVVAADVFRGARLERRRQNAKRCNVVVELLLGRRRDLADRLVQRQVGIVPRRPRVDLVVDVRDVAHVRDVLRPVDVPQQPEQHVEHDDGARIADVGEVVDRRPAHVHADVVRIDRREFGLLPGQRVIEFQRQS